MPDVAQPQGQAMRAAARGVTHRPSVLAKWFWGLALAVVGAAVSVAAWDFATALVARSPILGWIVTGLIGALVLVALIIALREIAAVARLSRVDGAAPGRRMRRWLPRTWRRRAPSPTG